MLDPPQPATSEVRGARAPPAKRERVLLVAGGGLLVAAAVALGVTLLAGGSARALRLAPNSVTGIDMRTNRVVAQVAVGTRPGAITSGSGSLWVANVDDQTVSRVDPRTLATRRTIVLADPPTGIAATRGTIWVAGSSASSASVTVRRIDPQFEAIDPHDPDRQRRARHSGVDRGARRCGLGGAVLGVAHPNGRAVGTRRRPRRSKRRADELGGRRRGGLDDRQRR